MKFKYIITSLATLCMLMSGEHIMAQKSHYSFDRIESMTPWLQSSNGAGLVFNAADENISSVYGYACYTDNGFKNYNQADAVTTLGLGTKSYMRLNKFYFYGRFDYNYTFKKNQTWLGNVYENSTLAPMSENIPGKVLKESYLLNAKVAYKLSDKSAFGISFDYEDANAAKKRDGRNSNVYSNLNVSPAYTFSSEYIDFGIGFNYKYQSESVDYKFFGDVAGKELYYFEGLFMYTANSITNANSIVSNRLYNTNTFGGSAQAVLKLGKLSFFNQFQALHSTQDMYEDLGNRKRYATSENMLYTYNGILKLSGDKMENSLHLNYANSESLLYNIANIYESIEGENNQWQYNEHGKSLRYTNKDESYGAMYHGFIKRDEYIQKIDFTLGFTYNKESSVQKLYPAQYNQKIRTRNYFASINKSVPVRDYGWFIIGVSGGLFSGNGNMLSAVNPITTGSIKIHTDLLETDYLYRTADKYNIGCTLKYNHILNQSKGMNLWIKANYVYNGVTMPEYTSSNEEILNHFIKDNCHMFDVTVGFNF